MNLHPETQAILALIMSDIQRKIDNEKIRFPLGRRVHEEGGIRRDQAIDFVKEMREKILFPKDA